MVHHIELHYPSSATPYHTVTITVTDADGEGGCGDVRKIAQPIVEAFHGRIKRLGKRGRKWDELGLNVFSTSRGEVHVWIVPN